MLHVQLLSWLHEPKYSCFHSIRMRRHALHLRMWQGRYSLTWQPPSCIRANAGQQDICQVLEVDLVLSCKALEALSHIEEVPALARAALSSGASRIRLQQSAVSLHMYE